MSVIEEQIPESEKSDRQKEADNELVVSYLTLRNLIGFCGFALPFVLVIATSRLGEDKRVESSISEYYYTNNGEVFVVIVCTLSIFLLTYKGYDWRDKLLTRLAAVCGLGVAFFPTACTNGRLAFSVHTYRGSVPEVLGYEWHLVFAAGFFISLAIISIWQFTQEGPQKTDKTLWERRQKSKRNIVYVICGVVMLICVVCIALYFLLDPPIEKLLGMPVVFTLESLAVIAFGISWLTKGQTLLPDDETYIVKKMREIKME